MFKMFPNFSSRKAFCKHHLYELKKLVHEDPINSEILMANYLKPVKMSKR